MKEYTNGEMSIRCDDIYYAYNFKQREFLQLHCLHFFGVPSFESNDLDRCLGDPCFLSIDISNTKKD
jgi:hypothetical protein